MKRSLCILGILLCSASCFGLLRLKTRQIRAETEALLEDYAAVTNESRRAETQLTTLTEELSQRKADTKPQGQEPRLDAQLADWLLAGSLENPPAGTVRKLWTALGLPWRDVSDYVLVSKS